MRIDEYHFKNFTRVWRDNGETDRVSLCRDGTRTQRSTVLRLFRRCAFRETNEFLFLVPSPNIILGRRRLLDDSELLSKVNDAFCKSHPLLAQKVVTRSARAAVSKIGADALVGGRSTSSISSSL